MNRQTVAWIFLTLPALLGPLRAADPAGTISGSVLDSSSAPVPKARVTVTNTATGLNREALTASDGGFVFPLVPVGPYTVSVEAPGFRRLNKGIERSQTVHPPSSITDKHIRYVWHCGPFFKPP